MPFHARSRIFSVISSPSFLSFNVTKVKKAIFQRYTGQESDDLDRGLSYGLRDDCFTMRLPSRIVVVMSFQRSSSSPIRMKFVPWGLDLKSSHEQRPPNHQSPRHNFLPHNISLFELHHTTPRRSYFNGRDDSG